MQVEVIVKSVSLVSFSVLLFVGTNAYEVDNATHTYTSLGTYTITCVAINAIGNTTIQYVVVVQIPVSADFILNSSSPVTFTTGNKLPVHTGRPTIRSQGHTLV